MNLEQELREALTRQEPPEGFAERVVARVEHGSRRPSYVRPLLALAAMLLLLAGVLGWQWRAEREQRIAAEKAKQELLQALEITASGLQQTRAKLRTKLPGGLI